MTHSDLVKIEVQGADILVAMRGTCFRVKYRKQAAPWLILQEYGRPRCSGHTARISSTGVGGGQRQSSRTGLAHLDRF